MFLLVAYQSFAVLQTGSGKTFTMEGLEYEHVASKSGRTVVRPVFGAETERLGVRHKTN